MERKEYHASVCTTKTLGGAATSRKVAGSIPAGVIGIFLLTQPFRPHCGPNVDSASNRNKYQKFFLRGKGGRDLGPITFMRRLS